MTVGEMMQTDDLAACCTALGMLARTSFYLSQRDWQGVDIPGQGRFTAAEAIAGAAPHTVTFLQIGAMNHRQDLGRRTQIQHEQADALILAVERGGVASGDIDVEVNPAEGSGSEPPRLCAKRMVVIVHY